MGMMFLLAALHCPVTIMENKTDEPWNSRDYEARATAHKSCKRFYPEEPCLVKFIKRTETDYDAICGEKRE